MSTLGTLYIVATPIGNLKDISQRAIDTLQSVDFIAAEDTRHSSRLLQHFAITTRTISLHKHNERERTQELISWLNQGRDIALITDAGTPLLSRYSCFYLVKQAREANIIVSPIPGPSAAIAALASGLPCDSFLFEGFLSAKSATRLQQLTELKRETHTLIFYEAPHRILSLIADLIEIFGSERKAVIAREITKTFETFFSNTLAGIQQWLTEDLQQQQGEFVVLVHGAEKMTNRINFLLNHVKYSIYY